jgi:hypothetical protein
MEAARINEKGRKYCEGIDNYCNGKIIEVLSKKNGLKYLLGTTNNIDCMMYNLKKDYEDYESGVNGKWSEIYLITCDEFEINIVELCPCSSKHEMEREMTKMLRDMRLDYININLYRRNKGELLEDVMRGIENKFIKKYNNILESEKFVIFAEEIYKLAEKMKKK